MIFDKFKGISEEREIVVQEKSNLETLLEIGDKIVRKYRRRDHGKRGLVHRQMCLDLKKKELEYNEADLISYVHAKSNQDLDEKETLSLGHFTGCLLEVLTERNEKQGKRTQIYINGHGNKFTRLFYFARKVDELVIDNFQGEYMCGGIGAAGNANALAVIRCKGYGQAQEVGAFGGKIGLVLLANNDSYSMGGVAAYNEGKVGLLLAANNKGGGLVQNAGSENGLVDLIVVSKQNDADTIGSGMFLGLKGRVNTFINLDCKENHVAQYADRVNLVLVANNTGIACADMNDGDTVYLMKLVIYNSPFPNLAKKLVTGEQAEKEYTEITQKYKTSELINLAESLSGKSEQEIFDILGKIKGVYDSITEKVKNDF